MKLTSTDRQRMDESQFLCARQRVFLKFPTRCTDGSIRWLEYAWRTGKKTFGWDGWSIEYTYEAHQ